MANNCTDLAVEFGQIHALLGENGADKSTLTSVLYGLHQPDAREILIDNGSVILSEPNDAVTTGTGMVHQHFMLVLIFTVAEFIALGYESVGSLGFLSIGAAATKVIEIPRRFGSDADLRVFIEDLPVGIQQRVEIIKVPARDVKVLILDKSTAVLTPQETDELIIIIRKPKTLGTPIVFVIHELREIRKVVDTITVIRRGRVMGTAEPTVLAAELTGLMVGYDASLTVDKPPVDPGDDGLALEGISFIEDGTVPFEDISLHVRIGEVLTIAGVQGNGQTELSEVILGLHPPITGSVAFDGQDVTCHMMRRHLRVELGFVPEDRTTNGVIAELSAVENMVLDRHDSPPLGRGPSLSPTCVRHAVHRMREEFGVRVTGVGDAVSTLSRGNQQKVILAREFSRSLKILVILRSTRGLDVSSVEFVHQYIVVGRDTGIVVLIVSSEPDEIYALADRIVVMYRERIVGITPADTTRDALGLMMAGTPTEQTLSPQEQTR